MTKPTVNVAIALLFHQAKVLIGWRGAKQHQGNKHEFPGGKVEQGETPRDACRREIQEEVGITINDLHVFDCIQHEYDDLYVHLYIYHGIVDQSQCEHIQAPWQWYDRHQLLSLNFPKANRDIVERLHWPSLIKIGHELNLIQSLQAEQMLYLRSDDHEKILQQLHHLSAQQQKKLILNIELWQNLSEQQQQQVGAIHLKQTQLMSLALDERPQGIRCIAACHDLQSLLHAQHIGCEAVLLSPVLVTQTHENIEALGWETFKALIQEIHIPVFALGGLKVEDLATATTYGAYGVAGIRHI